MHRYENNSSTLFNKKPAQDKQQEELLVEQVLFEESEQQIKEELHESFGREPTKEEIQGAFKVVLEGMRTAGLVNSILKTYREEGPSGARSIVDP